MPNREIPRKDRPADQTSPPENASTQAGNPGGAYREKHNPERATGQQTQSPRPKTSSGGTSSSDRHHAEVDNSKPSYQSSRNFQQEQSSRRHPLGYTGEHTMERTTVQRGPNWQQKTSPEGISSSEKHPTGGDNSQQRYQSSYDVQQEQSSKKQQQLSPAGRISPPQCYPSNVDSNNPQTSVNSQQRQRFFEVQSKDISESQQPQVNVYVFPPVPQQEPKKEKSGLCQCCVIL